jgi:hypothetical protein
MALTVLSKHGGEKNGITACIPEEIILKEMATKIEEHMPAFFSLIQPENFVTEPHK